MKEDLAISVVIPTYQRAHLLPDLLAGLERQSLDPQSFEVVIVDNGSTDETAALLEAVQATTTLDLRAMRIDDNRGPVPARNAGWRKARAPLIAFTDDDCVPAARWLEAGLDELRRRPEVGIVQGATEPAQRVRPGWSATRNVDHLTLLFEGCNLFVRRECLERTGGFDDRFVFYGEDTSMGWSILEAGWEPSFAAEAVVHHAVTHPPFRAHLRERWMEQNLVKVARLHPGFRREACWRPWCYRADNARFLLAAAGLAGGSRHPVALLATAPWLWTHVPRERPTRAMAIHLAKRMTIDATVAAAMLTGSVRERTVLL